MKRRRGPLSGDGRGARCTYCQRVLEATCSPSKVAATRDHVMPKSMGGRWLVWCCRQCNLLKGNMMPDAWARWCKDHPNWWRRPGFQCGERGRGLPPRRRDLEAAE